MPEAPNGIGFWDGRSASLRSWSATVDKITGLAVDTHGRFLAAVGWNGIDVIDIATRTCRRSWSPKGRGTGAVAFTPDGTSICYGLRNGQVRRLDIATGDLVATWTGPGSAVESLSIGADDTVVAGGVDGVVWGLRAEVVFPIGGHATGAAVSGVALSPSGTRLVSSGRDATVRLWDLATGSDTDAPIAIGTEHGHRVMGVAWSPSGKTFVSGGSDRKLCLWSCDGDLRMRQIVPDHLIEAVTFLDDETIVTAGAEGMLRSWRVAGLEPLGQVEVPGKLQVVAAVAVPSSPMVAFAAAHDPFPPTHVSVIERAKGTLDDAEVREAFWQLCTRYLDPIEMTAKRAFEKSGVTDEYESGHFLEWMHRRRIVDKFDPRRASFRRFIRGVVRHYVQELRTPKVRRSEWSSGLESVPEIPRTEVLDPGKEEVRRARHILWAAVRRLVARYPRDAWLLLRRLGLSPFAMTRGPALCEETGLEAPALHQALKRARGRLGELILDECATASSMFPSDEAEDPDVVHRLVQAIAGSEGAGNAILVAAPTDEASESIPSWASSAVNDALSAIVAVAPLDAFVLARRVGLAPFPTASCDDLAKELPALAKVSSAEIDARANNGLLVFRDRLVEALVDLTGDSRAAMGELDRYKLYIRHTWPMLFRAIGADGEETVGGDEH